MIIIYSYVFENRKSGLFHGEWFFSLFPFRKKIKPLRMSLLSIDKPLYTAYFIFYILIQWAQMNQKPYDHFASRRKWGSERFKWHTVRWRHQEGDPALSTAPPEPPKAILCLMPARENASILYTCSHVRTALCPHCSATQWQIT